jgi:hypothetical protein
MNYRNKEELIGKIKTWLSSLKENGKSGVIRIDYSGYGDSMNDILCDMEIPPEIESALFEIHPSPGFWNNDGGQGCIILNIDNQTIKFEHEDNYVSREYTECEY